MIRFNKKDLGSIKFKKQLFKSLCKGYGKASIKARKLKKLGYKYI